MPTLAYPVADVVSRLQDVELIKLVGLARDMQEALATPPRVAPAVFVVSSTTGGPIKFTGSPVQQERLTALLLFVWVRHHGTPEAVRAELDAVLAAIDARLAGWTPANPPYGALEFRASRDEFAHGQWAVVQVRYESSWNFSAQVQP